MLTEENGTEMAEACGKNRIRYFRSIVYFKNNNKIVFTLNFFYSKLM